jgi:hypothetical protein
MRIEVVGDGHVFEGAPKQILMQMKSLAFGAEHQTLGEYIEDNVANIRRGRYRVQAVGRDGRGARGVVPAADARWRAGEEAVSPWVAT